MTEMADVPPKKADDSTTPHGILERMKLDMEMEAALAAAYNLLAAEAARFNLVENERWRAEFLAVPMKVLDKAIRTCPTNSIVHEAVNDAALKDYLEWRDGRFGGKEQEEDE